MEWKELASDVTLGNMRDFLRARDAITALRVVANRDLGVRVFALRACVERVMQHVRSDRREVGGLLVGKVYEGDEHAASDPLLLLTAAVPSGDYRNSSVSLEMGTEVWTRAHELCEGGCLVAGWYHSHPNLGAFFSGTDRRTQRAFFYHHYSVGLVVDPVRAEQKVFIGASSDESSHPLMIVEESLEVT